MSNEPVNNESLDPQGQDAVETTEETSSKDSNESSTYLESTATASTPETTDKAEEDENPLKPVHVRILAAVALVLIILGLIPGIYADYQTSLILVAKRPKSLQKHRRIKRQPSLDTWKYIGHFLFHAHRGGMRAAMRFCAITLQQCMAQKSRTSLPLKILSKCWRL